MKKFDKKTATWEEFIERNGIVDKFLGEDPSKYIDEKSINNRKRIYPVMHFALKNIFNPYKHKTILEEKISPNGRPVIVTPTHGYKDDVVTSLITTNFSAYILFGNIDSVYRTGDTFPLYLIGILPVNRDNEISRKNAIPKVSYLSSKGGDTLVFSEGVWCTSDNMVVNDIFPGAYKAAIINNGYILPESTITHFKNSFGYRGALFDPVLYTKNLIKNLVEEYMNNNVSVLNNNKLMQEKNGALKFIDRIINDEDIKNEEEVINEAYSYVKHYFTKEDEIKKHINQSINVEFYTQLKQLANYCTYFATKYQRDLMASAKMELMYEARVNYYDEYYLTYRNPFENFNSYLHLPLIYKMINYIHNNENTTKEEFMNYIPAHFRNEEVENLIDLLINIKDKSNLKRYLLEIINVTKNYDNSEEIEFNFSNLTMEDKQLWTAFKKVERKELYYNWKMELDRLKKQPEYYIDELEFYYSFEDKYITTIDEAFPIDLNRMINTSTEVTNLNNVSIPTKRYLANKQKVRLKNNISTTIDNLNK